MSGDQPAEHLVYLVPSHGMPRTCMLGSHGKITPYLNHHTAITTMIPNTQLNRPDFNYDIVLLNDEWLGPNGIERRCLCFFKTPGTRDIQGLYGLYQICDFPSGSNEIDRVPPAPFDAALCKYLHTLWFQAQFAQDASYSSKFTYQSIDQAYLILAQADLAKRYADYVRDSIVKDRSRVEEIKRLNAAIDMRHETAAPTAHPGAASTNISKTMSTNPPPEAEHEGEETKQEEPPPKSNAQPSRSPDIVAATITDETIAKMQEQIFNVHENEFLKLVIAEPYDLHTLFKSLTDMSFGFCAKCLQKLDSAAFAANDQSDIQRVKLALISQALFIQKSTVRKIDIDQLEMVYAAACTVPNLDIKNIRSILGLAPIDEGAARPASPPPASSAAAMPIDSPKPAAKLTQRHTPILQGLHAIVILYTAANPVPLLQALYEECVSHRDISQELIDTFVGQDKVVDFDICLACLSQKILTEKSDRQITRQINSALFKRFFALLNERGKNNKSKIGPQNKIWNYIEANSIDYFDDDAMLQAKFTELKIDLDKRSATMQAKPAENSAATAAEITRAETERRIEEARKEAAADLQRRAAQEREAKELLHASEAAQRLAAKEAQAAKDRAAQAALAEARKLATAETQATPAAPRQSEFAKKAEILATGTSKEIEVLLKELKAKKELEVKNKDPFLTKLLGGKDANEKNLLMLALERLAKLQGSITKADEELVLFLIENFGQKICDKDKEGNSVLHYWAQRDFTADLGAKSTIPQTIFAKMYAKYKATLPSQVQTELQAAKQGKHLITYEKTCNLLKNKAGDTFLQQLLKHPSNVLIMDKVLTCIEPESDNIGDIIAALFLARDKDAHNIYYIIEKLYLEHLKAPGKTADEALKKASKPEPYACHRILEILASQYRMLLKNIYILTNGNVNRFGPVFHDLMNISGPDALQRALILQAAVCNIKDLPGIIVAHDLLVRLRDGIKIDVATNEGLDTKLYPILMSTSLICHMLHSHISEAKQLLKGAAKILTAEEIQNEEISPEVKDFVLYSINPDFTQLYAVLSLLNNGDAEKHKIHNWHGYTINIILFYLSVPDARCEKMNDLIASMLSKCAWKHTELETGNNLLHEIFGKVSDSIVTAGSAMTEEIYDETSKRLMHAISLVVKDKGASVVNPLLQQTNSQGNTPLQLLPKEITQRLAENDFFKPLVGARPGLKA